MKLSETKAIVKSFVQHNLALPEGSSNAKYLIPMLTSLPGEGKSSMIEDLAKELGMEIQTLMPSQFDAGELGGFPIVNKETDTYYRARPFFLPTSTEPMILFIDELPQAPTANLNIMAQLVNERRIGEHRLPSNISIVCAGNPMSARAGTNPMPSHLKDRLTHLYIETDHQGFRTYGLANGFTPEVTGFIEDRPEFLQKFDPSQDASPSPRSWERADTILKLKLPANLEAQALKGQIGEAALADFIGYLRVCRDLPRAADVFANPTDTEIPTKPDVLYALCSMLAHHTNDNNAKALMTYIRRFPQREFAAFLVRDCLKRKPELKKNKDMIGWIMVEGKELLL